MDTAQITIGTDRPRFTTWLRKILKPEHKDYPLPDGNFARLTLNGWSTGGPQGTPDDIPYIITYVSQIHYNSQEELAANRENESHRAMQGYVIRLDVDAKSNKALEIYAVCRHALYSDFFRELIQQIIDGWRDVPEVPMRAKLSWEKPKTKQRQRGPKPIYLPDKQKEIVEEYLRVQGQEDQWAFCVRWHISRSTLSRYLKDYEQGKL